MKDYSIYGLVNAYNKHMEENYSSDPQSIQQVSNIISITFGFFMILFILSIAFWIFALVILFKYWNVLPSWARALGLIGILPIFPFGPILTVIAVYIGKEPM
jgi:hypothetical protein